MNERCVEWRGRRFPNGYGHIKSRPLNRAGYTYAHRWAYEKFYGPIPAGLFVMHTCDNPPCINPSHLRLGTNSDNIKDSVTKGRFRRRKAVCRCGRPYDTTLIRGKKAGAAPACRSGAWYCRVCKNEYARRHRG